MSVENELSDEALAAVVAEAQDLLTPEPAPTPQIALSIGLVNSILGYLGNRPYVEVSSLIEALTTEAEASIKAHPPKE